MTEQDRQRIDQILDAYDEAIGAFHRSRAAMEEAMAGLRVTLDAVAAANRAQNDAIDGIMAANRLALLWRRGLEE